MSCDPSHLGKALKEVGVPAAQLQAGAQTGVEAALKRAQDLAQDAPAASYTPAEIEDMQAEAGGLEDNAVNSVNTLRLVGLAREGDTLSDVLNRLADTDLPKPPPPLADDASGEQVAAHLDAWRAYSDEAGAALDALGVWENSSLFDRSSWLAEALFARRHAGHPLPAWTQAARQPAPEGSPHDVLRDLLEGLEFAEITEDGPFKGVRYQIGAGQYGDGVSAEDGLRRAMGEYEGRIREAVGYMVVLPSEQGMARASLTLTGSRAAIPADLAELQETMDTAWRQFRRNHHDADARAEFIEAGAAFARSVKARYEALNKVAQERPLKEHQSGAAE